MNRIVLAACLLLPGVVIADMALLVAENPRTMQPPPGASVAAGFMTLGNHSDQDVVITGATSEAFDRIEIHESVIENDVARMIRQETLTVPAQGEVELAHGGFHLMLMGIREPLQPGQEIPVTLSTESGEIHVLLQVMAPGNHAMPSTDEGHGVTHKKKMSHGHDGGHGSGQDSDQSNQ